MTMKWTINPNRKDGSLWATTRYRGRVNLTAIQFGLGDNDDTAEFKDGRTVWVALDDGDGPEIRKFRSLKAMTSYIKKLQAQLS